jgi:hypothetical protein
MLFADDTAATLPAAAEAGVRANRNYLVLGAQGPDIFYHNQRRRPTGLAYGSLMHRHGYGSAVAGMWEYALEHDLGTESWAFAWTLGFATHAILDRATHPFINSRSGWVDPHDPHSERYRSMHPFLERLVDLALLERMLGTHPNEIDFANQVTLGEAPPAPWLDLMAAGLRSAYRKAHSDGKLRDRLTSAYLDTDGYYRFTNFVDSTYLERGLEREEQNEIRAIWLSIIHPPDLSGEIDVLNDRHEPWPHPCSSEEIHTESFEDLYASGLTRSRHMAETLASHWADPDARGAIIEAVGEWNLSDGRETERPCKRKHAAPLPLRELQDRIRESIRAGQGGRLAGRDSTVTDSRAD